MVSDGEGELAEGAASILPPAVDLLKEIVCHRLDDVARRLGRNGDGQVIEHHFMYLHMCRRQRDLFASRIAVTDSIWSESP